jgi:hypothetical protein
MKHILKQPLNTITLLSTIFLTIIVSLYLFTPVFDEWVIEKSLKRFCATQKEEFTGEFYSPAYICTIIEGIE